MAKKFEICREKPYPLGCYIDYDRTLVVRSVFGDNKKCGITLYPDEKNTKIKPLSIELSASMKRGNIYSARIRDIKDIDEYVSYNYFADDEYFCDPYAKQFYGLETFGKNVPDSAIRAKLDNKATGTTSGHVFDWGKDDVSFVPYEDSFVYLLHVRGFTKSPSSGVEAAKRGTYAGILEKIPYLKSLGVTAIEMMPAYEMNEVENRYRSSDRRSAGAQASEGKALYSRDGSISDKKAENLKLNYWGFKKGYYFAPRTAYCVNPSDAENEFKAFVKTMHENGLEVIMQFYFEENESGTLIIDALRFWRCTYHVDGFHLKGSAIPLRLITNEPLFTDVKIWYEYFDCGSIFEGRIPEVRLLADYNNAFLYNARRFLKSDDNCVNDFLKSMLANGSDHGIINYICDYEGFRLADLVAYEHKHNEENGENNKDGTDNNISWNCGIEGRTRKHEILKLRKKQMMNALTMLFFSQGTPMIFSGDEFGNSQAGNNNPYCQDNETGWVDWKAMEKNADLLEFTKTLSKMRYANRILHEKAPFKLMDYISCGYPDLSYHGKEAWRPDLSGQSHLVALLFCGLYEKEEREHDYIYVVYNMHWTPQELALPKLPEGLKWEIYIDTDDRHMEHEKPAKYVRGKETVTGTRDTDTDVFTELIADRSCRIYISKKDENYKPRKKTAGRKSKS
ncbi:alpha-amylase family glycosyl hydrolase [Butyrivibrio sp. FCS014]|uniref:alpha-amylase family glycosyl hydrolase n=1 Tax=Butyrivibrio sp. FCS014 TaxID=1408304 RepID=UPI0004655896|nr:alpha-amylase family glycosyl hydrolase [Butyrivibrio sp. FCS014]